MLPFEGACDVSSYKQNHHRLNYQNVSDWIGQQQPIVYILLACLILGGIGIAWIRDARVSPHTEGSFGIEEPAPDGFTTSISDADSGAIRDESPDAAQDTEITVHVVGAVVTPGVYALPVDSRAIDAVRAAGGFASQAAQESINMAQSLFDGAQVRIPSVDDLATTDGGTGAEFGVVGATRSDAGGARGSAGSQGGSASSLIDINTADATLLETLPGIGPSTSAKIIVDREQNGPYRTLADLTRVSGIGVKKMEALEGLAEAR